MPAVNIDRLVHGAELEAHEYIQEDKSLIIPKELMCYDHRQ